MANTRSVHTTEHRARDFASSTIDRLARKQRAANDNTRKLTREATRLGQVGGRGFTNFGNAASAALGRLKGLVGTALASLSVGAFATVAARFEDLRTSLDVVFAGRGAGTFELIQDIAAKLPISVEEITKAFIQLQAQGIKPTRQLITLFADAASITTNRLQAFQSLIRITARASQGGLGLEELEQLATAGIPVYDILADKLGIARTQISELGKDAQGAQRILNALQEGLADRFGGSSARALENLSTKFSNLGDNLNRFLDRFANTTGLATAVKAAIDALNASIDFLNRNADTLGPILAALATFLGVRLLGSLVKVGAQILRFVTGLARAGSVTKAFFLLLRANPIGLVLSALVGVLTALDNYSEKTLEIRGQTATVADFIQATFEVLGTDLKSVWEGIKSSFIEATRPIVETWQKVTTFLLSAALSFLESVRDAVASILESVGVDVSALVASVEATIDRIAKRAAQIRANTEATATAGGTTRTVRTPSGAGTKTRGENPLIGLQREVSNLDLQAIASNQLRGGTLELLQVERERQEAERIGREARERGFTVEVTQIQELLRQRREVTSQITRQTEELQRQEQLNRTFAEGVAARTRELQLEFSNFNLGRQAVDTLNSAFGRLFDGLLQGRFDFKEFARSLLADLARIITQVLILKPLAESLGNLFGNGPTGGGGGGGGGGGSSLVSGAFSFLGSAFSAFLGAGGGMVPSLAGGGTVPQMVSGGLRDRVPALLEPGEFVIRKPAVSKIGVDNLRQMNATGSSSIGRPVVNINNEGSAKQDSQDPNVRFDGEKMVVDIFLRDIESNGPIRQKIRGLRQ